MIKPLVLIVEDDESLGKLYKRMIEILGGDVELIHNGNAGIERVRNQAARIFDILIIDLHLPGVSGQEILQYTNSDLRYSSVLSLIITADELLGKELDKTNLADAVLIKPVSLETYESFIKKVVAELETSTA